MKSDLGRVILGVVLVAAAGPAGFLMYRMVFAGRVPPRPAGPPPAISAPASSAPAGSGPASSAPDTGVRDSLPGSQAPDRSPPRNLPQVALPDALGVRHRLADYRGHPLLLNFWATWCEPCRREIPLLKSLRQARPGLQVVGVAVDFTADVRRYAREMDIDYTLLMGENDGLAAVDALGMPTEFPFTVFADSHGNIVAVKLGELHADEAGFILGRLDAVDGGLALDLARRQIADGLRDLAVRRAQATLGPAGPGTGRTQGLTPARAAAS